MSTRGWYEFYVVDQEDACIELALQFYRWGDAVWQNAAFEHKLFKQLTQELDATVPTSLIEDLLEDNVGVRAGALGPAFVLGYYYFLLLRADHERDHRFLDWKYSSLPENERPDYQFGYKVGLAQVQQGYSPPKHKHPTINRAYFSIAVGRLARRWSTCQERMSFLDWLQYITMTAPGVSVRVVQLVDELLQPLEEGEADLLLSVVPRLPQRIRSEALLSESYRCLVHHTHPLVEVSPTDREQWLDVYCAGVHVLVGRSGRGTSPVNRLLEAEGRRRHIALRVPYFLAAAPVVQATQLILTIPSRAALLFAQENPDLKVLHIPLELPSFTVAAMWHTRFNHDPGLRWLRRVISGIVREQVSAPP